MTATERKEIAVLSERMDGYGRRVDEYHSEIKELCAAIAKDNQAIKERLNTVEKNFELCQSASAQRRATAKPWADGARSAMFTLGMMVITAVCSVWFTHLFMARGK